MRRFVITAMGLAALGVSTVAADVLHDYEDLAEGFQTQTLVHDGVTFRDANRVSGFYPDGMPFNDTENGNEIIVERATYFYNDFPGYGSPNNSLTFGSAFIPGDNLTIGALASVWMDLDEVSNAASFDLAYYEGGPWGGIDWRLDALRNGNVVASVVSPIAFGGDRDNPTWTTLSIAAAEFDSLHLYGWLNGDYTAPRGMIDDLAVTAVPEPANAALLALAGLLVARARRVAS